MFRFFCILTLLSLAGTSLACDPPARQIQPRPMQFAPASYNGQAMIMSQSRAGYGMASARGGTALMIERRRALLPGNRTARVTMAGGGGASVRMGGRSASSGACAT